MEAEENLCTGAAERACAVWSLEERKGEVGGLTVVAAVEQRIRANREGRPEPVQHRRLLSTHTIREIRH